MKSAFPYAIAVVVAALLLWSRSTQDSERDQPPVPDAPAAAHSEMPDGKGEAAAQVVRVAVVLTGSDGAPLPEPLQRLAGVRTALRSKTAPADHRGHRLDQDFVQLRPGDYVVEVFDPKRSIMQPVGECVVAPGVTTLAVAVPDPGRSVRLSIDGLQGAAYMLQLVHESGYTERAFGRADHEHSLLLPRGPFVATVEQSVAGGGSARHEYVFTVGEDVEQEVRWRIPQGR